MFCDKLREFRISQDLKQTEFAKKLGVSVSVVSTHETGKIRAYASYVRKVNKVFGADLPIVTVCKRCRREFYGEEILCPNCMAAGKEKKVKTDSRRLLAVAKAAELAGNSYGKYVAEVRVRDVKREARTPEFLELGKTIDIK